MSQALMTVEYWHMVVQSLCAIGYAFDSRLPEEQDIQLDAVLRAFRGIAFASDWTRVLCHALLLNLLDELCQVQRTTHSPDCDTGGAPEDRKDGERSLARTG